MKITDIILPRNRWVLVIISRHLDEYMGVQSSSKLPSVYMAHSNAMLTKKCCPKNM
jgi:hypothetical protein